MKAWFYDVESFQNFFCVTFKHQDDVRVFWEWEDERSGDLLAFLSQPHYLIGYNNHQYDDLMLERRKILGESSDTDYVLESMWFTSQKLILESHWSKYRNSMDLMRIAKRGENKKSLKELAIVMGWKKIQELPLHYKAIIKQEDIQLILDYNLNDVLITEALYRHIKADVNLRTELTRLYGVDVTSASNSAMSSIILDKIYSDYLGHRHFMKERTKRDRMSMQDIIIPGFDFNTEKLKKFLQKMKSETVEVKETWHKEVLIGSTVYDMKKGGLHSRHIPEIIESEEQEIIEDLDVQSFYPNLMIRFGIKPAHLGETFLIMLKNLIKERIEAKALGNTAKSEGLKVTLNSIFGKTNYENYWLYDPLALYRVTVNGQLCLLKLIEDLEEVGGSVIYANTDGITVRYRESDKAGVDTVKQEWQRTFGLVLESACYRRIVLRDVNNYLVVRTDGEVKAKGIFDQDSLIHPTPLIALFKQFDAPVVSKAIYRHFVEGLSAADSIAEEQEVLPFCMSQKVGWTFNKVTYKEIKDGQFVEEEVQRVNRYLVSKPRFGGTLFKWKGNSAHQAVAGQHVLLANDLDDPRVCRDAVEDSYYVREAEKVISLFKTKQLTLF